MFLVASVIAATPLLFATLGEIIMEKAGHLNLGVEGIMLIGAVMGFQVGLSTSSPYLALLAAGGAGALTGLIYALLTVTLRANQTVTGLALTIFGSGFSSFAGKQLVGQVTPENLTLFFAKRPVPLLAKIPYLGEIFFSQDIFVYIGYVFAIGLGLYLYHTRSGLNLRMVGENPAAADAVGIHVTRYKYIHIMLGSLLCGLGGAYLSLVYVPAWQENVVAGRGWIAVALVIFSQWSPYKALFGAYLFGGLDIIGFRLQKYDIPVSQYFIDLLPYIVTILVLVIGSVRQSGKNGAPEGLTIPYFREER